MSDNKKVLLTGASSGIGLATAKILLEAGYTVYGIGRSFSDEISHERFHKIEFNLCDTLKLSVLITELTADGPFDILVNNAGVGYYGTHETLTPEQIHEMVAVNLEAPLILTNLLLKDFKTRGGTIINISSVTAHKTNTHGCAYGATKAALSSFGSSLFEEARKTGVKVVNLHPDMTDTKLYRNADFGCDDDNYAHLEPSEIAKAVKNILELPEHMLITDLTIRPQKHKIQKKTCN